MSRRSRLQYHLATIGYRASRKKARSPRPAGLHGDSLSFGAAVRYELPSHTASRQCRLLDRGRDDGSCNCFSLMVTSDRSHKGLSPSITAPCPAHLRSGCRHSLRACTPCFAPTASGYWPDGLKARRKPVRLLRTDGSLPRRSADRQSLAVLLQLPPRSTRYEPEDGPGGLVTGDDE